MKYLKLKKNTFNDLLRYSNASTISAETNFTTFSGNPLVY